ncbi:radical SAM protein [Bradyrhizobium sp. Ai1a-2]|uniref:radical SAM/SPASM domain-containing protein n=1 Tax=Bradyrhizobium sp. Ai1a-2 TaxID=196490 RepID=UPI0004083061|nr:radical SAM protein [Bradyrhizobium sp. Ai1a-2]
MIDGGEQEDLLFLSGNNRLLRISKDLGRRLQGGLCCLTVEEAEEWNELAAAGVVSTENEMRSRSATFMDGANLAININLTAFCNLGCTYCFAEGGDYGRIKGKLESNTVADIIAFIEANVTRSRTVRLEFFGGEPLLNFARIRELCEGAEQLQYRTGIRFICRISTNLTVLPAGVVELFARHRFIVSVSTDGDAATHDQNRPTKGGRGSWARIIDNCHKVRAASDDITLVARMTVVGGRTALPDNVRALWKLNLFDYFQIYPGVVPAARSAVLDVGAKAEDGPAKTMSNAFLTQLVDLVRAYPSLFQVGNRFKGVLEYERIADMILEGKTALSFCSGGRNYFTFSPDHSIMPCHRLVGDPSFQVGTSSAGLSGKGLASWRLPIDEYPVCSQCWVRYICAGGCKQENFQATGDLNVPSPEGCAYQMQLVENIVTMLSRQPPGYHERDRAPLDDLFVSCGRPMVLNLRAQGAEATVSTHHFHRV